MLKQRDVARFIVAPDGYGKTSLAITYAETMFSWAHAFWVNAKSPCFIRDLDAHVIAPSCLAADPGAALVVIDDLPPLDPERAASFSQEVDHLLDAGCEVVVTCVPTCDMAGGLQRDRIRIGAGDLLLDDVELDDARSADDRARRRASQVGASGRIPALAWASGDGAGRSFVKSALGEEMPLDLLLAMASAFVIQSGTFADLLAVGPFDKQVLAEMSRDYPHLGFDDELDRFEAPHIGVDALAAPVKGRLTDLVSRSAFEAPEQLVRAWADILVESGKGGRACDTVREVCPRRMRAGWLLERALPLVRQACFFPALRLARDQDGCKGAKRVKLSAFESLCRLVLGDEEGALRCAKRHAFDASAPADARICSLLVAARVGKGALAGPVSEAIAAEASAPSAGQAGAQLDWRALARAWCIAEDGALEFARAWCARLDGQAPQDELCISASWLFGHLDGEHESVAMSPEVRKCARYIGERLKAAAEAESDYFAASAGLSIEGARNRGVHLDEGLFDAGSLIQLRKAEMGVLAQRRQFEDDVRSELARRDDWSPARQLDLAGQAGNSSLAQVKRSIPILTIRLFGHFEAMLGDVPLDPERFSRRNSRTLLVLLAMNQGRDVSRESIERAMWPQSAQEVAHKNYYTVWSNLRRALTLPDGTCPYLVRQRYGCRLETRYVQSDVERLSEICRELLFGVPDVDKWSLLFAEIDRDFSSDLMPAERKNRLVVQARNEYRTRLVDALVAATMSIVGIGNPQWGIWFARAAISHDETREDAYVALMRAQIAGKQRTAAMMTYLKCRRVLNDQLGIDPSVETTRLYESLLDSE